MNKPRTPIFAEISNHIKILGSIVALIWAIEIVDYLIFQGGLDVFGILPRTLIGLRGIPLAPFLHGGFTHVAMNTMPFIVLGWFILLRGKQQFYFVSAIAALVSGMGTWLFGSPGFHIGLSGVVFGYLGYLIFKGFFERSAIAISLSFLAAFLYGGLLLGVLPTQRAISWEGHLFGFIGGIIAARLLTPPSSVNTNY